MQSVRIDPDDHKTLQEIAKKSHRKMTDVLSDAIADLRKKFILEATNEAYARLRKDERGRAELVREREAWENASNADANLKEWK